MVFNIFMSEILFDTQCYMIQHHRIFCQSFIPNKKFKRDVRTYRNNGGSFNCLQVIGNVPAESRSAFHTNQTTIDTRSKR